MVKRWFKGCCSKFLSVYIDTKYHFRSIFNGLDQKVGYTSQKKRCLDSDSPPSHRSIKEPTLIRVKLILCKSMRFRSFKRSTVVSVDEIAPKLWAVKVGTLKKLLPFCQSQTTGRRSGFDSVMTGSSLKCNRSHFSTLPAKIDLNEKWLPKQKTI